MFAVALNYFMMEILWPTHAWVRPTLGNRITANVGFNNAKPKKVKMPHIGWVSTFDPSVSRKISRYYFSHRDLNVYKFCAQVGCLAATSILSCDSHGRSR